MISEFNLGNFDVSDHKEHFKHEYLRIQPLWYINGKWKHRIRQNRDRLTKVSIAMVWVPLRPLRRIQI